MHSVLVCLFLPELGADAAADAAANNKPRTDKAAHSHADALAHDADPGADIGALGRCGDMV